jgi:N-acyl-L-homoserine lactone synthetase
MKKHIVIGTLNETRGELIEKVYRLRYQVYCEERSLIKKQSIPYETDAYDRQSVHFVATDPKEDVVAVLRMILPGERPIPTETLVPDYFRNNTIPCYAELSRLIYYRQALPPVPGLSQKISSLIDEILVRLFHEMYLESVQRNITHWFSLMEPSLHRLLRCYGFHFEQIGPSVEFYGTVYPYCGSVEKNKGTLFRLLKRHKPPDTRHKSLG